jgi:hypothetical protein
MEMDGGIVAGHMPPVGLFAGPAGATHRTHRQIAHMAVQALRPAVNDPVGRDLRAEVPPRQAFGFVGLDRFGPVMHAGKDRGVF